MSDEKSGKGDRPRPVNKRAYDRGYLRIFGKKCTTCHGEGCEICYGIGYVPNYTPGQRRALEDTR